MALLTDKTTEQDLENRLTEFGQFGVILNYMLDLGKINIDSLEKIFFDTDLDRAIFEYQKVLTKVKENYIEESYNKYSREFPNNNMNMKNYNKYLNYSCVNRIIGLVSTELRIDPTYVNTYQHLLEDQKYTRKK